MKVREKKRNYIAINIFSNLKCNKEQQTILHKFGNGVRHNFAYVSGPFLCGGGFFISVQMLKSTSLQCQMAIRLIWSCSSRSQEPCKENGMQNGRPKLPEMIQQRLLLKSFSTSKWLWLGFSSAKIYSECPQICPHGLKQALVI